VRTKATYAKVDVLNDEKDTRNNGGGMTPDRMEKKYSSTNCQHIGYAEHIKNSEALKLMEYAQYDATPEAYASTSRKSPFKASTSSKVLKASTNSVPYKALTLNAGGIYLDEDLSPKGVKKVGYSNSMVNDEVNRSDVFPDNHVKKVGRLVIQDDDTGDNFRLTAKDAIVSHNIDNVEKQALLARRALFEELPVDSSNETNGLQVQKAEEKIKKLDEEHEALVRIDSDELKPTI
ncbi:hypothetical protein Tco_0145796, partial [Tanacetum coccineum]